MVIVRYVASAQVEDVCRMFWLRVLCCLLCVVSV